MSHFTVAVFSNGTKTVEELLAPYQENNMGDCPKEYLEFVSATEREREEYETGGVKRVCLHDGKYMYPWDEDGLKKMFSHTIFNDGKDHSGFYKGKKGYLFRNTRYILLKLYSKLPLYEKQFLQSFAWPMEGIGREFTWLVPCIVWREVGEMLDKLGLEAEE